MKIGILGSRSLACELTEWIINQNYTEIIGVVPPPFNGWWDDNFRNIANKHNIPIYENIEDLLKQAPDILFSINYWKKIELEHISKVPKGIINIHHSFLLKYKGRYSTSWAIINARKKNCWQHGTTLHYINEKLDEGNIIASYSCPINENDTAESLFEKVELLAIQMFKDYFMKIIDDKINIFLQPDSDCYYYGIDSNKNLKIEYGTPIEDVFDFVRAWSFKDRPKPFFEFRGKKIVLSVE